MDPQLEPVVECICLLRSQGLTTREVMRDFFLKRLAPLQERSHPAWEYQGEHDATRLQRGGDSLVADMEAELLTSKFMGPGKPGSIPGRIPSLGEREDSGEILLRMPSCDEHGARGTYLALSPIFLRAGGRRRTLPGLPREAMCLTLPGLRALLKVVQARHP